LRKDRHGLCNDIVGQREGVGDSKSFHEVSMCRGQDQSKMLRWDAPNPLKVSATDWIDGGARVSVGIRDVAGRASE
jgi:hypothetical protein